MGDILSTLARVEDNLEKIPLKLAEMLEEGVGFLEKKYSSESAELLEELTALGKLTVAFINHQEETFGRERELFENLMEKHKAGLKDLLDLSQKSEESREKLAGLEGLIRSQAKTIEELKVKLASEEEKAAAEVKPALPASPACMDLFSVLSSDDEEDEEEEDVNEPASAEVMGAGRPEEILSPLSSPYILSPLELELEMTINISSDSESDSELAFCEE